MLLGVFQMFGSPSRRGVSAWRHPASDLADFHRLDGWVRLARQMERDGFDFLFLADSFGYPSHEGRILDVAAREGLNFPLLDPQVLVAALAGATDRLGLVVTETTGLHHPLETARRFATLDHLTSGRIGMNVVTGSIQDVVASLFGHDTMVEHDERYDRAEDYLRLTRAYWEDAWSDGALVDDAAAATYVDPAGLHRIQHTGPYYRSDGYFPVDPSPQRSPVIFQAGTSGRGKLFAATHADCVLMQAGSVEHTRAQAEDLRRRVAAVGRDPRDVRLMVTLSATVAGTTAEATRLAEEFTALQTVEVAAAMYLANTGIDLLALDPDRPLSQVERTGAVGQIGQSNLDRFSGDGTGPEPTVREILRELHGRGLRGLHLVGDGPGVAADLEAYLETTTLDGVLLDPLFGSRDVAAFGELVVPLLRERGLLPPQPTAGTLREQVFGPRVAVPLS